AEIAGKVAAWRQLPDDRLAAELFPHGAAALRWAIVEEKGVVGRNAAALIARCGGLGAEDMARDCLMEPTLPGATRHQLLQALNGMGGRPPYAEYTGEEFRLTDPAIANRRPIPDSAFRVLWHALEGAREMLGNDLGALFQAWTRLITEVRPAWGALRNARAWSAAIAREALIVAGHPVDDGAMAARFSCSKRGMLRCAKAIERSGTPGEGVRHGNQ
ncbi:MAG: hypothetical protein GX558_10570, partial [Clostridiales bacterium]|nr:hypothetical protein [Clostridiales bacterium]